MTLTELKKKIDALVEGGYGDNEVSTQGCDCWGDADDVVIEMDVVLITRS